MTNGQRVSERITEEVTSWPGVLAGPGTRGEFAFKVGGREIGHLHGDDVAHFGFPKGVWTGLFEQGRIDYHPVFPGKPGFGARRIRRGRRPRRDRAHAPQLRARGRPPRPPEQGGRLRSKPRSIPFPGQTDRGAAANPAGVTGKHGKGNDATQRLPLGGARSPRDRGAGSGGAAAGRQYGGQVRRDTAHFRSGRSRPAHRSRLRPPPTSPSRRRSGHHQPRLAPSARRARRGATWEGGRDGTSA